MIRSTVVLLFILAAFSCGSVRAQESSRQFVLLENGQMIKGAVEHADGKITVVKPTGSRIVFSKSKIVTISKSKSDIYWQKCAQLSPTDLPGHVSLCRWCISHELFDDAYNQIDLLQAMNASSQTLFQLSTEIDSTKLSLAQRIHEEKFAVSDLPSLQPEKSDDSQTTGQIDQDTNTIQQVGFEADIETAKRAKYIEKLEQTTRDMPDYAVVMFKRKIQPLLINSCYTAKCHDSKSEHLPLTRATIGQTISKRSSQRNLYNILQYTDFKRPLESKLLAAAALPHAGASKPILKIGSPQFQNLRLWLIAISEKPFVYHPVPSSFFESDMAVAVAGEESEVALDTNGKPEDKKEPEKAPELKSAAAIPKEDKLQGSSGEADESHAEAGPPNPMKSNENPFDPTFFNEHLRKRK